jgi:phage tail-like protein
MPRLRVLQSNTNFKNWKSTALALTIFGKCAGIDAEGDPIGYWEGTEKVFAARKLPGLTKYSYITLKPGITDNHSLWDWRKKVIDGKTERKNGSIVLCDDTGEEKLRCNFVNAWPSKWIGPSFNATEDAVAVEELEIAHQGMTQA